jgi:hypothetical protein
VLTFACFTLSGCVVGQKIRLDSTPQTTGTVGSGHHVSVTVEDQREAVLSGEHKPWRIGQYRAALGVPWPVNTEGNRPLADQIKADLEEDLASLGFVLGPGGSQLEVLITQWEFTGYQNGSFTYSLLVNVLGAGGGMLRSDRLVRVIEIKGTLVMGARGGFERDMPRIYTEVIGSMARNNPAVLGALRS